ncbi:MAG: carboxypeptidase regulatory-like domain-containing protein [Blastocatellia bacterium]
MRRMKKLALLLMMLLAVRVELVFPQASISYAEIRGQVTDPSGAAVAAATITATETSKGTTRTVKTDENGAYVILSLQPGTYNMKVEATGFVMQSLTNIVLNVGQTASLPVTLGVNGVQAEVNVAAGADIVEVERTQQASVINEKQISSLPINRRNYLDFAMLTPGVSSAEKINDSTDYRVAQTPQSGLSFGGNNGRGNSIMVDGASTDTNSGASREVLGQEAVQEFQVNRNSYNAEYGGAFGGVVNIVSKTGTNDWHGSMFGFFRHNTFDARNAFDFNPNGISPFSRQQYGSSVGGPISKDKTFLFTAFEGLNQKQTSFVNLLNDPNLFNLTSGQTALFNFLGAIPNFAPLAAGLSAAISTGTRTRALFDSASGQFPFNYYDFVGSTRVDHTLGANDSGYARFNMATSHTENQAAGALTAVSRGRTFDSITGGLLLSETHLFTPTTINEIKAQYSYLNNDVFPNDMTGPEINIDGFGNFGRDIFLPSYAFERRYEIADNLSLVRAGHTWRFGGQYQAVHNVTDTETYFGGRFNFGAAIPLLNLVPTAVQTPLIGFLTQQGRTDLLNVLKTPISALQAFNASLPIVYQQGFGESNYTSWSHRTSFYGQDTWKALPNFTLNYGLRYYIEDNAAPIPTNWNNVQPRVGFSWDPFHDGKMAIRGGGGIFVGSIDNQIVNVVNELSGLGRPSDINIVLATATSNALGLPTSIQIYQTLLAQGVIGKRTITAADLKQFGLTPGPGRPLEVRFGIDPAYRNPITEQASLAIQRDLGGGYGVEVSYLFSRGLHLTRNHDINPYKATGPISPLSGTPSFIRFPTVAGQTSDFLNPLRLQDNQYESTANSFYHAGTIQLTKRFSHNYAINANYTYSKAMDEVTDFNSDFSAQNPLDLRVERALSAFDQRHRVVFSGVFMSPVKGTGVVSRLFSDWALSPIFIAGSGRPFNVVLGIDANGDGVSTRDRPCVRAAADQACIPNSNIGRNVGHGEPFYNVDMRLARRFSFRDNKVIELTFEAFNLFNHTNFTGINNVIGTTPLTDGRPHGIEGLAPTMPLAFTSAAPARQLQFGARFNF